jgi:hypothetical protein
MNKRISTRWDKLPQSRLDRDDEPRQIGEILAELLDHYERRFSQAKIIVLETDRESGLALPALETTLCNG